MEQSENTRVSKNVTNIFHKIYYGILRSNIRIKE